MPHIRHPVFRIVTHNQLSLKAPKRHVISTIPQDDAYTSLGLPHGDVYSSTLNFHSNVCTKPELVGHRPHFLLGLGGTGTRWDIISGTPFYTKYKMPKIDKETIRENVPPSASHSTPTHFYSADKRPKVVIDEIGVFDWLNGLCVCPTNNA